MMGGGGGHAKRQLVGGRRAHRRRLRAVGATTHGFDNLREDVHDKV